MFKISNSLISILNTLTLLISFPITGIGLWLHSHASSRCDQILLWPILIAGLFLMVVALLGIFGSFCNVTPFLWIYLFLMFLMIVALFCFTVFAIVVTSKGAGDAVSGGGYKEYRLGDYSGWLQRRVGDAETWRSIKSCMADAGVCGGLQVLLFQEANDLYLSTLSSIQSGCCRPPSYCGYKQENATYWRIPTPVPDAAINQADCTTWSNDQKSLCFDCNSCKAGVLANIKTQWKKIAAVNFCLLLFLVIVYAIGCCALRSSSKDDRYFRYKGYH
ncbi:Tetraspanin-8 [Platanthera zijinensis]|uniref:Tetraspanin-8 n=1 Tax=Platanthera zijinensis TaxID=2320716 RepID=A0AAP0BHS7_9ASPA